MSPPHHASHPPSFGLNPLLVSPSPQVKIENETLCGRLHYSRLCYGNLCYVHIAAICMLQLHVGLYMWWAQLHMLPFSHQLLFRKVVQKVSNTYLIVNANKVNLFQIKEDVYATLGFYSTLHQLLLMLVLKNYSCECNYQ